MTTMIKFGLLLSISLTSVAMAAPVRVGGTLASKPSAAPGSFAVFAVEFASSNAFTRFISPASAFPRVSIVRGSPVASPDFGPASGVEIVAAAQIQRSASNASGRHDPVVVDVALRGLTPNEFAQFADDDVVGGPDPDPTRNNIVPVPLPTPAFMSAAGLAAIFAVRSRRR